MPATANILVVANRTALSARLDDALRARLNEGPARFTLVVPVGRGPQALEKVAEMQATLREAGIEVDAEAGVPDPLVAVMDVYSPGKFDEIIVSTLPMSVSKWLHADLPLRIERHTGALVSHLVAHPAKPEPHLVHLEKTDDDLGVIKPLTVLAWGARPEPH